MALKNFNGHQENAVDPLLLTLAACHSDPQRKAWAHISVVQACHICLKLDYSVLETQAKCTVFSPIALSIQATK